MKSRAALSGVLLVLSVFGLQAQVQAPRFEEQVEVRLIDLEVHVTDREGRRVHGLDVDDFILLENGVRQEITNFTEITGAALEGEAGVSSTSGAPRPAAIPRQPRTMVLFIDHLPLTPPQREKLFTQLRDFVHEAMAPGDRASVVHWWNPAEVLVELTTDIEQVNAALADLAARTVAPDAGTGLDADRDFHEAAQDFIEDVVLNAGPRLPGQPPSERVTMDDSDPMSASSQMEISLRSCARRYQDEMEWKTTAMSNLITSMSGIEGRKLFIYVASRFPANAATYCQASMRAGTLQAELAQFDSSNMLEEVTRSANAAGVVFYALRPIIPRGIASAEHRLATADGLTESSNAQIELLNDSRALGELAEETGGLLATGDEIFRTLPRVIQDLDSYYSIAYRTSGKSDDGERRVEIRIPDRDVEVRARRTIIEKSRETEVREWLIANLFAQSKAGELGVELVTKERLQRGGDTFLPIELRIPLDQLAYEGSPPTAEFTVLTTAGTSLGIVTPVREDTRAVPRPEFQSGVSPYVTYELELQIDDRDQRVSLGVFDRKSGLAAFHLIDQDGTVLMDREDLEPSWLEWRALLDTLREREQPILVYIRPSDCTAPEVSADCQKFERETLEHPEILRRMSVMAFSTWMIERGVPPSVWPSRQAGLALLRGDGAPIGRWQELPDPAALAALLDRMIGAARQIEQAGELAQAGKLDQADLVSSWIAMHLGRKNEARKMLEDLIASEVGPERREMAQVRLAFLDATVGGEDAEQRLRDLAQQSETAEARTEAWLAVAAVRLNEHDRIGRIDALRAALDSAPKNSQQWVVARNALAGLDALQSAGRPIRILAPAERVISGAMPIEVDVTSDQIVALDFFLDGKGVAKAQRPAFRAVLDFGKLPEPHSVRVIGRDATGAIVGEDTIRFNDWRDRLSVEIVSPSDGRRQGDVDVEVAVGVPSDKVVSRVEILLGAEVVSVITNPPYNATIQVPGSSTVLSARAWLTDGTLAEDTVLLNTEGFATETIVHLVEIPVVVSQVTSMTPADLELREEGSTKEIETVLDAADAPLTVGLVIDNSASMWERYLDVQAAASEFLDRVLEERDRAFIVSFDSLAKIVQEPTTDKRLLESRLRAFQPEGLTVMNDAMMLGLLQFEAIPGRRALVVFSDGVDKGSRHDLDQVLNVARRSGVPVYLIRAQTEELTNIPSAERYDRERDESRLRSLIEGSGGNSYMLSGAEALRDAYAEIAEDIRRQLLVTYLTEGEPGELEWREISLRSRKPGVSVRGPKGVLIGTR